VKVATSAMMKSAPAMIAIFLFVFIFISPFLNDFDEFHLTERGGFLGRVFSPP
jgi:hypothetical protein